MTKLWYYHYSYAIGVVTHLRKEKKKSELWVKSKGSLKTKNKQSTIWKRKGIAGEGQCNMFARI